MFTPSWSQHKQPLSCLLEAEGRNLVELGAAGQRAGKLQPAAHVDPVTPPAPPPSSYRPRGGGKTFTGRAQSISSCCFQKTLETLCMNLLGRFKGTGPISVLYPKAAGRDALRFFQTQKEASKGLSISTCSGGSGSTRDQHWRKESQKRSWGSGPHLPL